MRPLGAGQAVAASILQDVGPASRHAAISADAAWEGSLVAAGDAMNRRRSSRFRLRVSPSGVA